MNDEKLQQVIEALSRQNQLLEGIDWKLWEIYKSVTKSDGTFKKD